ncbi:MAG: acyltransferase family protein [Pontibacterium sp.]
MDRNISLDALKLVMALMVVGIHSNFLLDVSETFSFLTVNGLFRIAVPVFFIISGYYFFNAVQRSKEVLWLKRLVLLYLVWMIIYSFFWLNLSELSLIGGVKVVLTLVMGYHHLWFLPAMLIAAFVLLFLKHNLTLLLVSMCLCAIVGVALQYLRTYEVFPREGVGLVLNHIWSHRNALFFAFPFFSIGFLVKKYEEKIVLSNLSLTVLALLGFAMLLMESWLNYSLGDQINYFDNYISLLFFAPLLFLLCLRTSLKGSGKKISLYSAGVYFVHSGVLSVLRANFELGETLLAVLGIVISLILTSFVIQLHKKFSFIL